MPRYHIEPQNLTPEERLARIVKLLAVASVRLAEEEMRMDVLPQPIVGENSPCKVKAESA